MPGFDHRLREGLRGTAQPAAPTGVLERILERKIRLQIVHRIELVALVILVVAGSIGGVYELTKVFHGTPVPGGLRPISPRPSARPSACQAFTVSGDFDGDGRSDSATSNSTPPGSGCPGSEKVHGDLGLSVELGSGVRLGVYVIQRCDGSLCGQLISTDLNHDGVEEIAYEVSEKDSGAFRSYRLYRVRSGQLVDIEFVPGLSNQAYPAGVPLSFEIGDSPTRHAYLVCGTPSHGMTRIVHWVEQPSADGNTWQIKAATIDFDGSSFKLLEYRRSTLHASPSTGATPRPHGEDCLLPVGGP